MNQNSQFPDDENGRVLRQLEKNGDDLSISRDITFNVVFGDEVSARRFFNEIKKAGRQIKIEKSDVVPAKPWDVSVAIHMVPSHRGISQIEDELGLVAAKFGGVNDGWGCFSQ